MSSQARLDGNHPRFYKLCLQVDGMLTEICKLSVKTMFYTREPKDSRQGVKKPKKLVDLLEWLWELNHFRSTGFIYISKW